MDNWNTDLWLHVIQFLAVKEAAQLSTVSKRCFYLVKNYQRMKGPGIAVATSHEAGVRSRQLSVEDTCRQALARLHSKPCLAFYEGKFHGSRDADEILPSFLPHDTVMVGVSAETLQTVVAGHADCSSQAALLLGCLPEAKLVPFSFEAEAEQGTDDLRNVLSTLDEVNPVADYWKMCMLFAAGDVTMDIQGLIVKLQQRLPELSIVGGVCELGFVSTKTSELETDMDALMKLSSSDLLRRCKSLNVSVDEKLTRKDLAESIVTAVSSSKEGSYTPKPIQNGVFGVFLGGNVPVQAVVSRGMKSAVFNGPPRPESPLYVKSASFHRPGEDGFVFAGSDMPAYHEIEYVENKETGAVYKLSKLRREFGNFQMVGFRRKGEDGFSLSNYNRMSPSDCMMIFGEELGTKPLVGVNIDFFNLDGESCIQDMELRMRLLQQSTRNEDLMGAVLFVCNGRGPFPGVVIPREMSDARIFAARFPSVPCLGFYAGGEIGPDVIPGRQSLEQSKKVRHCQLFVALGV